MVMDLEDHRNARIRLAWAHAHRAVVLAKRLERDPDAVVGVEDGLACVAAWKAFCEADGGYRKARDAEVGVDQV